MLSTDEKESSEIDEQVFKEEVEDDNEGFSDKAEI